MLRTTCRSSANLARAAHRRAIAPKVCSAAASTHAISNPTLANIEKRWEGMPPQEQAELWMALRDRMKGSWKELTLQEKKACECTHVVAIDHGSFTISFASRHAPMEEDGLISDC